MTREEQKAILAEILANATDTGMISGMLTVLAEDYMSVTADLELTQANNAALTADNASLREQNMNLFLKVGTPIADPAKEEDEEPAIEDLKYEDLFDANGKLI